MYGVGQRVLLGPFLLDAGKVAIIDRQVPGQQVPGYIVHIEGTVKSFFWTMQSELEPISADIRTS